MRNKENMVYREKKISVVIPAYNECALIERTLKGIPDYVDMIYLVDDCSNDSTCAVAENTGVERLTVIKHEKNKGVGAALISGYKQSMLDGCDIVAIMAGDNQMDPDQLIRLLDPLIDGDADYTKGNRLLSEKVIQGMPKFRLFGNSILTLLTKISSGYWDLVDPQNGYTATTAQVLQTIDVDKIYPGYGYPNDILVKLNTAGFRVKDIVMPPRYADEKSKIKLPRYILRVSNLLFLGFFSRLWNKYVIRSLHPLVFFYIMGIITLPAGVLVGAYIAYLRIFLGPVTAGSLLLPVFLILTGLQTLIFAMLFDMQSNR